ncbi:unnamed protein product, partial [Scytosiphon promiscuus]
RRLCADDSCTRQASWGSLAVGAGTACADHKDDIVDGPVVNFKARCKVGGCSKISAWGVSGQQPSHCRYHGPLG